MPEASPYCAAENCEECSPAEPCCALNEVCGCGPDCLVVTTGHNDDGTEIRWCRGHEREVGR